MPLCGKQLIINLEINNVFIQNSIQIMLINNNLAILSSQLK